MNTMHNKITTEELNKLANAGLIEMPDTYSKKDPANDARFKQFAAKVNAITKAKYWYELQELAKMLVLNERYVRSTASGCANRGLLELNLSIDSVR